MTETSFESFYEQTWNGMVVRATALCGRPHDAEDAVAEAYEKAFSRWNRVGGYDSPEAWVYRVMQRRLWRMAKEQARQVPAEATAQAHRVGPEHEAEARMVLDALASLPPRQRQVLVLQCLYGLSQEEVRSELGLRTRSTVAAHLFKARRTLERVLGMAPAGSPGTGGHQAGDALFPTVSSVDPLAAPLRAVENWARAMIEADPDVGRRVRDRVAAVRSSR
jgi:RNA polymerase sigma factor (sigma-70 family)